MRSTTSGRRLIGAALAGFLVLLVGFAGWLVAQHNLGKADSIGSVVAMFAALVGLPISLISLVRGGAPPPLAASGEELAEHLAEQVRRQLSEPGGGFAAATPTTAMPTRWTAAPARLRTTVAAPPEPGRVPNFATTFRASAQRRFVVIGRAGFGKSYLATRLALDLIAQRGRREPVPVVLRLRNYEGQTDLRGWIAEQVAATYRLAIEDAQQLVESRMVVPILDGLDEMSPAGVISLLPTLNQTLERWEPVVVTSREPAYQEALHHREPLTNAAVVQLEPLDLASALTYLEQESRTVVRERAVRSKWHQARATLHERAGHPLAEVLQSPLMVILALAAYDRQAADPSELFDRSRFADRSAIENYLIDTFIDNFPEASKRLGNQWPAMGVWRWLSRLAAMTGSPFDQGLTVGRITRAGSTQLIRTVVIVGLAVAAAGLWPGASPRGRIATGLAMVAAVLLVVHSWPTPLGGPGHFDRPAGLHRRLLQSDFAYVVGLGLAGGALGWLFTLATDRHLSPAAGVPLFAYSVLIGFGVAEIVNWTGWFALPVVVSTAGAGLSGGIVFGWIGGLIVLSVCATVAMVVALALDSDSESGSLHPAALFAVIGVPLITLPGAGVIAVTEWLAPDSRIMLLVTVAGCALAAIPLAPIEIDSPLEGAAGALLPALLGVLVVERSLAPAAAAGLFAAVFAAAAVGTSSFLAYWLDRTYLSMIGRIPVHLLSFLNDAVRYGILRRRAEAWEFRHDLIQQRLRSVVLRTDGGPAVTGTSPPADVDWKAVPWRPILLGFDQLLENLITEPEPAPLSAVELDWFDELYPAWSNGTRAEKAVFYTMAQSVMAGARSGLRPRELVQFALVDDPALTETEVVAAVRKGSDAADGHPPLLLRRDESCRLTLSPAVADIFEDAARRRVPAAFITRLAEVADPGDLAEIGMHAATDEAAAAVWQCGRDRGDPRCAVLLAVFLLGEGLDRMTEAVELFSFAGDHGIPEAHVASALYWLDQSDPMRAVDLLRPMAHDGRPDGMIALGIALASEQMYDYELDRPFGERRMRAHTAEARDWYERALAAGASVAYCFLGELYADDDDFARAEENLIAGARAGYAKAAARLGRLHDRQNLSETARQWFRIAVDAGEVDGLVGLGQMALNTGDRLAAYDWFERAAGAGDAGAMRKLADLLEQWRDGDAAQQWLERAAATGDKHALEMLGWQRRGDESRPATRWRRHVQSER